MRARDGLKEGAAPCGWGGAEGKEGLWWWGKEEWRNERKGTRLCPFGVGELLDQLSHLVCTPSAK